MRTKQWHCGLLSLFGCLWLMAYSASAANTEAVALVQPPANVDTIASTTSLPLPEANSAEPEAALPMHVEVPAMTSRVIDLAGVLDSGEFEVLRQTIAQLEDETNAQIAVLIVPTTGEDSIEQFAIRVFDIWNPGRKEEDDGVLVLVAVTLRLGVAGFVLRTLLIGGLAAWLVHRGM